MNECQPCRSFWTLPWIRIGVFGWAAVMFYSWVDVNSRVEVTGLSLGEDSVTVEFTAHQDFIGEVIVAEFQGGERASVDEVGECTSYRLEWSVGPSTISYPTTEESGRCLVRANTTPPLALCARVRVRPFSVIPWFAKSTKQYCVSDYEGRVIE